MPERAQHEESQSEEPALILWVVLHLPGMWIAVI